MNLGFDAKRAFNNNTGLGNYSRFVLSSLYTHFPDHNYFLYSPKTNRIKEWESFITSDRVQTIHCPWQLGGSLWRMFQVPRLIDLHNIDVFHGLSNELPVFIKNNKALKIVTIHDVLYLRYPNYYAPADRILYGLKTQYACKKADKIIAVSEQTSFDLQEYYNVPSKKIEVIYQSCNDAFKISYSEEEKKEARSRYNLPEKYILNVGTLEKRKNAVMILKALALLPQETIHVVFVGRPTDYKKELLVYAEKAKLLHRVHFIDSQLQFSDLPKLYQSAQLLAYPSVFEGFGIPIIEGLYSGIPVITSEGGCFPEAGGNAAKYANSQNPEEWAAILRIMLHENNLREKAISDGKVYVEKFSNKVLASQLFDLYKG